MNKDEELLAISKLVFVLRVTSGVVCDLDVLLEVLFANLRDNRQLPLEPLGAVVLFNPRGRCFQVAQFGMAPAWKTGFRWESGFFDRRDILPGSLIKSGVLDVYPVRDEQHRLFLLPLNAENQFLGYTVLFAPLSYLSAATHLDFMTNMARALSGSVQRTLAIETMRIRALELEEARADGS